MKDLILELFFINNYTIYINNNLPAMAGNYVIKDDGTLELKTFNNDYISKDGKVVIPETINGKIVSSIGERVFDGNLAVKSATIPTSIEEIGYKAFNNCSSLNSLPNISKQNINNFANIKYGFRINNFVLDGDRYRLEITEQKTGKKADEETLYVTNIYVDGAGSLKRLRTAPQGRGYRIRKRSNHVTVFVDTKNTNEEK